MHESHISIVKPALCTLFAINRLELSLEQKRTKPFIENNSLEESTRGVWAFKLQLILTKCRFNSKPADSGPGGRRWAPYLHAERDAREVVLPQQGTAELLSEQRAAAVPHDARVPLLQRRAQSGLLPLTLRGDRDTHVGAGASHSPLAGG